MVEAENKLDNLGLLSPRNTRYFVDRDAFNTNIEDDHIPFLKKSKSTDYIVLLPYVLPSQLGKINGMVVEHELKKKVKYI